MFERLLYSVVTALGIVMILQGCDIALGLEAAIGIGFLSAVIGIPIGTWMSER